MELLFYVHSQLLTRQITVMKRANATGSVSHLGLQSKVAYLFNKHANLFFLVAMALRIHSH